MIAGAIVALAVLFGVFSLATISSYNQGVIDGMSRGTQIVVPNAAPVMPAAQAPYVYQQPYYNRPMQGGGFSFFGTVFNVLIFIAFFFVITRILRGVFGRRRWGGSPWMHGHGRNDWRDWRNGPINSDPRSTQNPNDFRGAPNKQNEQVI
jgi:hypothetical protein